MSTYMTYLARSLQLRVVDAAKPKLLEVLSKDITKSTELDHGECAFATACKRSTKDAVAAFFFKTTGWIQYKDRLVRYLLPPSMQREIVSFDRGAGMAPGIYQMSPPRKRTKLSAVRERSKKRKGRHPPGNGHIKRKFRHYTTMVRGQKVELVK